ncbi:hypothetical protein Q9L42_011220 [Methylomarinum sp. Ch1-1]|uniref:Transposase n=1 Tax=Methylomarinum roseum TaxID=3067653 RepID=A0AAU7NPQ8_9GAMM|nr:hypothetical protein [Methylomarinum sp. Ch1-1]MDP4521135.1 hypothetical protein [Methylomarinum sp. Ch1-1]
MNKITSINSKLFEGSTTRLTGRREYTSLAANNSCLAPHLHILVRRRLEGGICPPGNGGNADFAGAKNLPCHRHLSIEIPNSLRTFESYFMLVPKLILY